MAMLDEAAFGRALDTLVLPGSVTVEYFAEIASTNSHLMACPAPSPGAFHVAVTDNQTAGRGRHGRRWLSPPGSGLALSLAYTFRQLPRNLPALALALGVAAAEVIDAAGVPGIAIKWPNDLIARGRKLGGILTESRSVAGGGASVVAGIGINLDLPAGLDLDSTPGRSLQPIDLRVLAPSLPESSVLAAQLVEGLCHAIADYDVAGLAPVRARLSSRDWLLDRNLRVDTGQNVVEGCGAGIAADGALLVDTGTGALQPVFAGTITVQEPETVSP